MKASYTSVQGALTKNHNLKAFRKRKLQNPTAAKMKKRFLRSHKLLRCFTAARSNNILFSAEEIITIK